MLSKTVRVLLAGRRAEARVTVELRRGGPNGGDLEPDVRAVVADAPTRYERVNDRQSPATELIGVDAGGLIVEAVAPVGDETVQVVPVVFDVEPDGSAPVFNGIRDQLGDHEFEVRDYIAAQCVGEAIANCRACDLARGRHGWERQRDFARLKPSIVASEDLVHPLLDADEGIMAPIPPSADGRAGHAREPSLASQCSIPLRCRQAEEHRVPSSKSSLVGRLDPGRGPAFQIANRATNVPHRVV